MSKGKKRSRKPNPKKIIPWIALVTSVADLILKIVEVLEKVSK